MRALGLVLLTGMLIALAGCGRPQVTGNPTTWHEQVATVQEVIAQQDGSYRLDYVSVYSRRFWLGADVAFPESLGVHFEFVSEAGSREVVMDGMGMMYAVAQIQFVDTNFKGSIEIDDIQSFTSELPSLDAMDILLETTTTPRDIIAITMPEAEKAVGRPLDREDDEFSVIFSAGSDFDPADRSAWWGILYDGPDYRLYYGVDARTGKIVQWPDLTPPPAVFSPPYGTSEP